MTEEESEYLPAVIKTWLQQEQKPLEDVMFYHIHFDTRELTQEETNYSQWAQHVHTGLVHITATMSDGSHIAQTFTKSELEQK